MPDGFDAKDLRLLARRAAAVKAAVRGYNGPLPFNVPLLLAYLDLLEATPEPHDGKIVLNAARMARLAVRAAYQDNLGDHKEPEAELIDRELSALVGDLQEMLLPFGLQVSTAEPEGPTIDADKHQAELEEIRQHQHWLRSLSQKMVKEFNDSPIRTAVALFGLPATATLVEPWLVEGFAALFVLALLADTRVLWGQVKPLLDRQDQEISAFEAALKRNKSAVETVTGLFEAAKDAIAQVRDKLRLVRRGLTRIFRKAEPPPDPIAPPPPDRPDPPAPELPPSDCRTEYGQPGYLLAGTCYPQDAEELRLEGMRDIDFAKLAGFQQLADLNLRDTSVSDLTPLAGLAGLQILDLASTRVSDLTPVAGLTNLQMLWLDNTQVSDLTPVASLVSLEILSLDRTPVSDLSPVAGLASLQTLWLDNTQVSDLTPVAGLANLRTLSLDKSQVSDLTPVAGLASLEGLSLYRTQVSDLTPLKRLGKLHRLVLQDGSELGGWENDAKNRRAVQEFVASL